MVEVVAPKPNIERVPEWRWIALTTIALMCIGLVMMTSASMDIGAQKYNSAFFHFKRRRDNLLRCRDLGNHVLELRVEQCRDIKLTAIKTDDDV